MKHTPLFLLTAATLFGSTAFAGSVGGAHGGGGNIRPMHPIPQAAVKPLIEREKWEVALFFNQMEIDWKRENRGICPNDLCRKLYDGKRTIFDALKDLNVTYLETSKCQNPKTGEQEDGAAYPETNTICLSPYSMAPQMDRMAARAQSLALYAHEASHMVGTTDRGDPENDPITYPEGEATALQDEAIEAFYSRREQELIDRVQNAKERVVNALGLIDKSLSLSNPDLWRAATSTRIDTWNATFGNSISIVIGNDFDEAFAPEENRFAGGAPWTDADLAMPILGWNDIALLDEGIWVQKMLSGWPNSDEAQQTYQHVFGSDTVLPYPVFRSRYMPESAPARETYGLPLPMTPIYEVLDAQSLRADLKVVKGIYETFQARLASYAVPAPQSSSP